VLLQRGAGVSLLRFVQCGSAATDQQLLTSDTEISQIIAALLAKRRKARRQAVTKNQYSN
jgi:hypothetical protein